jgi:hypothetical protein
MAKVIKAMAVISSRTGDCNVSTASFHVSKSNLLDCQWVNRHNKVKVILLHIPQYWREAQAYAQALSQGLSEEDCQVGLRTILVDQLFFYKIIYVSG